MLQTINCIRMGQILLDENLQLFILCNNCHIDLRTENDFRRHLESCDGVENLFRGDRKHQLKFSTEKNSTQLFGKTTKGIKEFLLYDYKDVELEFLKSEEHFIDLINIEEELLDPKWYSDFNSEVCNSKITQKSSKQYDVLVEEVTPFVQFKENVKSNIRANSNLSLAKTSTEDGAASKNIFALDNKKEKTSKRRLPDVKFNESSVFPQTKEKSCLINSSAPIQDSKRCKIKNATTLNGSSKLVPVSTHCVSTNKHQTTTPKPSIVINSLVVDKSHIPIKSLNHPTKEKETAKILNKLQNLGGLQIKRTAPPSKTDDKTLEIIAKLKSKGMKVKIVNKHRGNILTNTDTEDNREVRPNFNKNLIIRKVN